MNKLDNNLNTEIDQISQIIFYQMEKYCQLVIDLVEDIEDSDFNNPVVRGSFSYDITNILEIINPIRIDDINILTRIKTALDNE
jgi:hypothetical protein